MIKNRDRATIETRHRRPVAPQELPAAGRELWARIVESLPADFFRASDWPLLGSYIRCCLMADQAQLLIDREGMILDGRMHPALKVASGQRALAATLAGKLRLCPSSRTRPDAALLQRVEPSKNPLDKYFS